ncbi:MAG: cation diffusion facilitator family transporter [Capsulimonadales bacterium]|nr:cation diffusion facilitator family transporter [Capsulimonadales bacterium]
MNAETPLPDPSRTPPHPADAGVRSTLIGIGVNLLLVVGKATAGVVGHSYALIADAIESGMDVLSSALVLIGLKVASRPADENHPQGHGKAEPLATVVVSIFLFLAAYEIGRASLHEILHPHTLPAPWTLIVLVAVVVVKETLARFLTQVGGQSGSGAVQADAQHQRADVITSAAAFLGISIALIGHRFSPDPRWSSADDWAALLASVFIAYNGLCILRGALYELTDARPGAALEAEVRQAAARVPGVRGTDKCFVRKMGFDYFVEIDIRVDPSLTVEQGHRIAHAVQDAVREEIKGKRFARVLAHVEPASPDDR